jgi:hypothetical protein
MLPIADWLEKLGLSQYAERFVENGIDVSVLRYLTEQDLEKIGVLLGHRRKMLAAIAALEGGAPIPQQPLAKTKPQDGVERLQPASISTAPPAITAGNAENVGERRYLTVMFCDLVGSTAISAQLDAEEWRDLVGSYLDATSVAITERWPCGQEARRRRSRAVWLSGGTGKRRRARSAGGAVDPARARRNEPHEHQQRQAGANCPHRPRHRAGGGRCRRRDLRRRRQCRGTGTGAGGRVRQYPI